MKRLELNGDEINFIVVIIIRYAVVLAKQFVALTKQLFLYDYN